MRIALAMGWLCAHVVVATAGTAGPTVTGPITVGGSAWVTPPTVALAPLGWMEEEFFLEGTAQAYTTSAALGEDGQWPATLGATAAYKTRIVVRRPIDPATFNGTVVVEWLNVSGGVDASPDWTYLHTLLIREGYAWVGVSAQRVGVEGGSSPIGFDLSLKAVNPARYGTLLHPGDSFSYDMFTQVAGVLQTPNGPAPMGDLVIERIIAAGESQSAFRLVTYVNAIHPLVEAYDGYLIHSRGGGAAGLVQPPEGEVVMPNPARIRDDLEVPVLTFQTETDMNVLGFLPARQPDTKRFRLWEVAGTAHSDVYQLGAGSTDVGPAGLDTSYLPPQTSAFGLIQCDAPINAGPHHFTLMAAFAQLDRWVRRGRAPRSAPRFLFNDSATPAFVLDARGNVRGGVRSHMVDAPIARHSGLGQTGGSFCRLFGTSYPFAAATLADLYPTHARYVRAVRRATKAAMRRGWLLKTDAKGIIAAALASSIGTPP